MFEGKLHEVYNQKDSENLEIFPKSDDSPLPDFRLPNVSVIIKIEHIGG